MNLSIYSQEDIERAKKRGRAYLCTSCYHKSERQVKKIDVKGRIEHHILKTHVTPEDGRTIAPCACLDAPEGNN